MASTIVRGYLSNCIQLPLLQTTYGTSFQRQVATARITQEWYRTISSPCSICLAHAMGAGKILPIGIQPLSKWNVMQATVVKVSCVRNHFAFRSISAGLG